MTFQVKDSSMFPISPSEQADVGTSQVYAGRWEPFNWLRVMHNHQMHSL